MFTDLKSPDHGLKLVFWKSLATIAGFGLEHRERWQQLRPYLPLAAAAAAAFVIGRLAGILFVSGLR